jgi:hypothetical protein
MALDNLSNVLSREVDDLIQEGRAKGKEDIFVGVNRKVKKGPDIT